MIISLFSFLGCEDETVKADPLLQLYIINYMDLHYTNSCQYPKITLTKGNTFPIEIKKDERIWFRFSNINNANINTNASVYSFKISKQPNTELLFFTNDSCGRYIDSSYVRLPSTVTPTELTYKLYPSDIRRSEGVAQIKNGYYIEVISGDPNIVIWQE
ncbi:hypothetical protein P3G55_13055 [Leptospira sp. 96542]|nr:hypothetical protein [Leptospira sp. 96542]